MKVVGLSIASCVSSFPLMEGLSNHELVYTLLIIALCARNCVDGRICFVVRGAHLHCTWECISKCCVDSQMRRINLILIYCLHFFLTFSLWIYLWL